MSIVWLASYPKSGNTWLRFLLHNVVYGVVESSEQVARRIPDIHADAGLKDPGPEGTLYAKTHFKYSAAHPFQARTKAAVYIARHPIDVFLSALNYRHLQDQNLTGAVLTDLAFADEFLRVGGDRRWELVGYGNWCEHVRTWLAGDKPFPVHVMRYEALKADTLGETRRMLAFLKIEVEDAALAKAVKASSFDNMRALEVREKSSNKVTAVFKGDKQRMQQGKLFMNKGLAGQSLAHIRPDLDARFKERFAGELAMLGY